MKIHWFSVTVFSNNLNNIWTDHFRECLGDLVDRGYGGKLYRESYEALVGSKVYYDPVKLDESIQDHFHIELPGQACECVSDDQLYKFLADLKDKSIRYNVKRVDFAFDELKFSPDEFLAGIKSDDLVSLAKRECIRIEDSPFKKQEVGEKVGCKSVYLGSMASQRMVRCYNKRGFTRLEFQVRDERCQLIMDELRDCRFMYPHEFEERVKSHLRQYMDFNTLDWWLEFVGEAARIDVHLKDAKEVSFVSVENWIDRQVSVALSVYIDVLGPKASDNLNKMIEQARYRNRTKYNAVLEMAKM